MSGSFNYLDEGNVTQIGDTGLYWVRDRTATGTLGDNEIGGLESDIEGTFSMTYDAIIAIANQEGPFWGTLEIHDDEEEEDYTAFFQARSIGELISFDTETGGSMEIEIEGRLRFTDNAYGRARFEGAVEVALDQEGHIVGIVDSDLTIEGFWNPDVDTPWDNHFTHRWNDPIGNRWSDQIASRWTDRAEDQGSLDVDESTDADADAVLA